MASHTHMLSVFLLSRLAVVEGKCQLLDEHFPHNYDEEYVPKDDVDSSFGEKGTCSLHSLKEGTEADKLKHQMICMRAHQVTKDVKRMMKKCTKNKQVGKTGAEANDESEVKEENRPDVGEGKVNELALGERCYIPCKYGFIDERDIFDQGDEADDNAYHEATVECTKQGRIKVTPGQCRSATPLGGNLPDKWEFDHPNEGLTKDTNTKEIRELCKEDDVPNVPNVPNDGQEGQEDDGQEGQEDVPNVPNDGQEGQEDDGQEGQEDDGQKGQKKRALGGAWIKLDSVEDIKNRVQCKEKCQALPECTFFRFHKATKKSAPVCYYSPFLTGVVTYNKNAGYDVGVVNSKRCQEMASKLV